MKIRDGEFFRKVPEDVKNLIYMLNSEGYEAYAAGGCVRDMILGLEPKDYDVTTSAPPGEVQALLESKGVKTFATGIRHGTVTALTDLRPVEITTYRIDGEYTDNRHPDEVVFTTDLAEDLSRRDFTVNAMVIGEDGLVDNFGGMEDLNAGIIRAVGNPKKRFEEDALRILRALRFASTYGFTIEEETSKAAEKCRGLLGNISAERIYSEFTGIICGKDAGRILRENRDILFEIVPELRACAGFDQRSRFHLYDVFEHSVRAMENVRADSVLRMADLFHDVGKPDCFSLDEEGEGHFYGHAERSADLVRDILNRFKTDNATRLQVITLVKNHHRQIEDSDKAVRRALNKMGVEDFFLELEVKRADGIATGKPSADEGRHWDNVEKRAREILARNECVNKEQLAINGRDLLAMGIPQGREIGRILAELLEKVIDGRLENDREKLLREVKNREKL